MKSVLLCCCYLLVLVQSLISGPCVQFAGAAEPPLRGMTLNPAVTASDLADLATWNAKLVRHQLHWVGNQVDAANEAEFLEWLDTELDRFDALLPVYKQYSYKVVLALHSSPGGFASRVTPAQLRIFEEAWPQATLLEVWRRIATRYSGDTTIWGFDLLNEPAQQVVKSGLRDWNSLAAASAEVIRAIDPSRTIILQPIYGDESRLNRLKPLALSNVIYSIHFYYPPAFTKQGIPGARSVGVVYPIKKKAGSINKKVLARKLKRTEKFQKKYKVPIYVGEFSAVRWAPKNSTYRYMKDLISLFEQRKWSWTYHAFREENTWSAEHTTDKNNNLPAATPTDRELLLKKFFAKN